MPLFLTERTRMKLATLYKLTYLYLAAPLFVFILTWLNAGCAVLWGLLLCCAFYKAFPKKENSEIICNKQSLTIIAAFAFLWCFFAGIGYFYYQSFDYHFRNAVFRDLINYDWPVFYDKADTPLVYYMAFWLIPAGIAKFFHLFISNQQTLFLIGNIVLYLYAVFGTILIFAHLLHAVKAKTKKQISLGILLFIFFSGLDIIGYTFFKTMQQPFAYHLDWWASFIQYSSITTSQFWVFNQFIPTALLILLVYNERCLKNYGLILAFALFFAPYPTFGIGLFALADATQKFFQNHHKISFIGNEIFSIPNLVGVFWIIPLLVLYFITNSEGMDGLHNIFKSTTPQRLLLFMLLEFLIYVSILFPAYSKDIFFRTMLISLIIIPFLRLDQQNNFCMRASIPAIIMLAVFIISFILENHHKYPLQTALLGLLLIIGAVTPLTEFYRGFHNIAQAQKIALVQDDIYTLNQRFIRMPEFGFDVNHQFTAQNYRTDIFWQYIAHTPKH